MDQIFFFLRSQNDLMTKKTLTATLIIAGRHVFIVHRVHLPLRQLQPVGVLQLHHHHRRDADLHHNPQRPQQKADNLGGRISNFFQKFLKQVGQYRIGARAVQELHPPEV
jgi:hypothetical protein